MRFVALFFSLACLVSSQLAAAQSYPARPIRLINPYAAGGPTDTIAREIASSMSIELGQQIIVDVKAGGGTVIGASIVANAMPDGYTILLGTQAPLILQPMINPKMPYDAEKDLIPIGMFTTVPGLISVPASSPVKTLKDLIAFAKERPGKLNFASSGISTGSHLGGEMFNQLTGTQMLHIPYRGAAPATLALVGKEVDVGFVNITPQLSQIQAGTLRPLAVLGGARSSTLPQVPTAIEAGVPGLVAESWYGLFAPGGTPAAIINTLYSALEKVMAKPDMKVKLAELGADITVLDPKAFQAYITDDRTRLKSVLQKLDLKQK
jgi:tripartite-type tricarboxylate transporter receptor subunit TctC